MTPLLLALPLVATAPVPKDFRKELPTLDGAWHCTGIELQGRVIGQQNSVWKFEGEMLTIEYPGRGFNANSQPIKLDPKASPPGFEFANGGNQLGVYELKGETLTICLSMQIGVRPPDAAGGPNVIKYNFTRVKDK